MESDETVDDERFVYQVGPEKPLSEAVTVAVAKRSGLDDPIAVAEQFGPLYDAIDPSALDALFDSTNNTARSEGSISFTYAGYHTTVDTTGRVELATSTDGTR
ncbi:HalOD1 output domain-containing protein [Natrialbaceae archaeon A-arb3/5]